MWTFNASATVVLEEPVVTVAKVVTVLPVVTMVTLVCGDRGDVLTVATMVTIVTGDSATVVTVLTGVTMVAMVTGLCNLRLDTSFFESLPKNIFERSRGEKMQKMANVLGGELTTRNSRFLSRTL